MNAALTTLIAAVAAVVYITVSLCAARAVYGRRRAREIDGIAARGGSRPFPDTLRIWHDLYRFDTMGAAVALGAVWPLWPAGLAAARLYRRTTGFIEGSPVRSHAEARYAREQRDRRIAELEAENDRFRAQQDGPPAPPPCTPGDHAGPHAAEWLRRIIAPDWGHQ